MALIETYFQYTKQYKNIYGEKTVVLMQVGAFFEVYGKINKSSKDKEKDKETIEESNIQEFCAICDLNMSEKVKGSIVMAGFRDYGIDKYIVKLQNAGYTCVVYVQVDDDTKKEKDRVLEGIYSPGTFFNVEPSVLSNNIMCIRFMYIPSTRIQPKPQIIFGMSCVDVLTGQCNFTEHKEPFFHNPTTYDEIEKYYTMYNPSELIVLYNSLQLSEEKINDILQFIGNNSKLLRCVDLDCEKQEGLGLNNQLKKTNQTNQTKHISNNLSLTYRANNCEKEVYKIAILKQFYNLTSDIAVSSFIESNMLHYYECASHSFCFLLDFLYTHNPNLVNKIQEPNINNNSEKMLTANHSLKQLNFLSSSQSNSSSSSITTSSSSSSNDFGYGGQKQKLGSVISFLNNCVTHMGKRKMNYILMNPITNVEKLNMRYNYIEYVYQNYNDFMIIRDIMKPMKDTEKLYRKLIMNKFVPSDLYILYDTILRVFDVYKTLSREKKHLNYFLESGFSGKSGKSGKSESIIDICLYPINDVIEKTETQISYLHNYCTGIFNIEHLKMSEADTYETHFFKKGIYPDLDECYKNYVESQDKIQSVTIFLSELIKEQEKKSPDTNYCKIHETDKSGICIKTTNTRYKKLDEHIKNIKKNNLKTLLDCNYTSNYDNEEKSFVIDILDIKSSVVGKDICIRSNSIDTLCDNVTNYKHIFSKLLRDKFNTICNELKEMNDAFTLMFEFVVFFDVIICGAYNAYTYNYCKPRIELNKNEKTAYFKAQDLRHILIEQFQCSTSYVANDIMMGCDGNGNGNGNGDGVDGILLFGTNAVGKSSLIKSIGISVILAQCGMFVPCSSFIFYPFQSIFTRILGNDNIFKGLSTFAVEMSELRTILNMANENSLILGDELCSGTEIGSALGIFSAGLVQLHQRNSKFIFATHFHEITNAKCIMKLEKLKMKHMSVIYDKEKDKLIYDRVLRDGPGNNMYGLEVCKSLHLPKDFLDLANNIRLEFIKEERSISSFHTSKYNSKKIMGNCEKCGKVGTEIHHILEQKNADIRGFIGDSYKHKNHISNLMSICEDCHLEIHNLENK
jgi:DNA mismatch repair protein MutS